MQSLFRSNVFILSFLFVELLFNPASAFFYEMESPTEYVDFNDVWGTAADDVFAVGTGGTIVHYDGEQWSLMESRTTRCLNAVWGVSASDVYAVGNNGTILHYNGNIWESMIGKNDQDLSDIWGLSPEEVYAVGENLSLFRYDGADWSFMNGPSEAPIDELHSIWGTSSDNIYVSGGKVGPSTVFHYNGTEWETVYSNSDSYSPTWSSLWGTGSFMFAVFYSEVSLIAYYDGLDWQKILMTRHTAFNAVHGTAYDDVYIAGSDRPWATPPPEPPYSWSMLYHFDGNYTKRFDMQAEENFNGVWCISSTEIFLVGDDNNIVFYDGNPETNSTTTSIPTTTSTTTTTIPDNPCIIESILGESSNKTDMVLNPNESDRVIPFKMTGKSH